MLKAKSYKLEGRREKRSGTGYDGVEDWEKNGRVARAELGEVDHVGDGDVAQPGGPVLGCGSRRQRAGAQTSLAGQAELSSHHDKCGSPLQLGRRRQTNGDNLLGLVWDLHRLLEADSLEVKALHLNFLTLLKYPTSDPFDGSLLSSLTSDPFHGSFQNCFTKQDSIVGQ